MVSGSLDYEVHHRLEVLYNKHHKWLMAAAKNISKDKEIAEDLVSELYIYLAEKKNEKVFYADSWNLIYCRSFLRTRFINGKKRDNKMSRLSESYDRVEEPYDEELDRRVDREYQRLIEEIGNLKRLPGWSAAMLFEMYFFSDKSMDELAGDIGLSKSTVFLNTKRVKGHMKSVLKNPFKEEE